MVFQQSIHNEAKEEIKELEKEISILYSLGVEEYEIKYLMSIKKKKEASLKWKDNP